MADHHGGTSPIDFGALAEALLRQADSLVQQWLPNGQERNGRWYVGDFDGSPGESANVNLSTGTWIDNGGSEDDKGGDLISLYARIRGLNNGQAARELMRDLGWTRAAPAAPRAAPLPATPAPAAPGVAAAEPAPAAAPARRSIWRAVVPVPAHAPRATFEWAYRDAGAGDWVKLQAVRTWAYVLDGVLFGHVARFERTNSKGERVKDTLPRTWCVDTTDPAGSQRWHWKAWEEPRPLYVPAQTLASGGHNPGDAKPVLVVEGEKCADAAHALVGDAYDVVSWPGGSKTWSMALWRWVAGRTVYLWPDADAQRQRLTREEREQGVDPESKPLLPVGKQPGMQAMLGIGLHLQADHQCTVWLVDVGAPGDRPAGWDVADAIADGWDGAAVLAFIAKAKPFKSPDDAARAKAEGMARPLAGAGEGEDAAGGWRKWLLASGSGAIKAVRENVVLALDGVPERGVPGIPEVAGVVAFNEFTNDVVKLRPAPWGRPAGVWDEVEELELGCWLTREHWLPPMARGTLEEAVAMVAKRHRFHPVRSWLEGLRGKWDGHKRDGKWLRECCLEEDEWDDADPLQQYLARVGTWLLMAICARVMTPGCKFDYMVIFEGPQGWGKSTLARLLGGDYFADTGLILGDKDSYQNLQGVLVYEWGELDSLNRAEVTKVKQFVSSQKDRFRASFDRRPKDYPRQVIFIGTTNEDHYLVDITGNRRFWPVRITRQIDLDYFRANREQLFAEALHYFEAGDRFHPTTAEQKRLFEPQQAQRQIESAIAAAVVRFLYDEDQKIGVHGENGTLVNTITVSDLLTKIGISVDKQTHALQRQATAALRQVGWVRFRSSRGDRPWMFRRPDVPNLPDVPAAARRPASSGAGASVGSTSRHDAAGSPAGADSDCPF